MNRNDVQPHRNSMYSPERNGLSNATGKNVQRHRNQMYRDNEILIELGNTNAPLDLGLYYYERKDYDEARKWLSIASEKGNPDAAFVLGGMFHLGQCVEKNDTIAYSLFKTAEEIGSVKAMYSRGCTLINGEGVQQDEDAGIKLIHEAAKNGEIKAQKALANFYKEHYKSELSEVQARYWMLKAAYENGDCYAKRILADWYMEGYAFEKDVEKAKKLYTEFLDSIDWQDEELAEMVRGM